ncbi:uncharacterized protein LOC117343847 [Pecten maximus]|uniref:uncharacterized protein LOC117343847 n=1 Tax=Pecten maximus TaxID=6579 RepID=UPI001459079A|nr:uncharacterized protein LOC117343847 [Pecten maximus]
MASELSFLTSESKHSVSWYCNDCRTPTNLWKGGNEQAEENNDDVVLIGTKNRQDAKTVPKACKQHQGKLCDLYCSDCKELICSMCVSNMEKLQVRKSFEDQFSVKKQRIQKYMTDICDIITHPKTASSGKYDNDLFIDNINIIRTKKMTNTHVDYIADCVKAELSSLSDEEFTMHKKYRQLSVETVEELKGLDNDTEMADTSCVPMCESECSSRTSMPSFDTNVKYILPDRSIYVSENFDGALDMLDELHIESQHVVNDISSY